MGPRGGGSGGPAAIGALGTAGGGGAKVGIGGSGAGGLRGSVGSGDVAIDSAEVEQGQLAAFVRARMGGIRACYETQLRRDRSVKGRISIRFTILETGSVADVTVGENGLGSAEVSACIVGIMRSWRTPFRPAAAVSVEYPFVFSAREG